MSYFLSMHLWSKKKPRSDSLEIIEFSSRVEALCFAYRMLTSNKLDDQNIDFRWESSSSRIFPHNKEDILEELKKLGVSPENIDIENQVKIIFNVAERLSN